MPGALITESLSVILNDGAQGHIFSRTEFNAAFPKLELISFEFIIRIFDKKILTTAYRAFHL